MKFPKPWFRPSRGLWFVTLNGKQINLGSDKDAAFDRYKDLLVRPPEPPPVQSDAVVGLIDQYLDWCQEHRSAGTYEWYRWRLDHFAKSIGRALTVAQLRPFHIDQCLRKDWSGSFKNGIAKAVQRVFRWAMRKGYIDRNPVAFYEKPRMGKRTVVIAPGEFEFLLSMAGCPAFCDLLQFTWETAARPQESIAIEGRHVDIVNARIVFPPDEAKGQQWPRVIYLNETAMLIVRRLLLQHPDGALFRNDNGAPWQAYAVNCAFTRMQIRIGLKRMKELGVAVPPLTKLDKKTLSALPASERDRLREERNNDVRARQKQIVKLAKQHAKKYCLYNLRHSWLDRALKRGVDPLTCAILMGHRDPSTLAKVYQHLSQSPEYLRNAAKKATA